MSGTSVVRTATEVVTEVVTTVVVEPVRGGRLRTAGWPTGLGAIVVLALAGMTAAALLVLAAPLLRRYADASVFLAGDLIFPRWTTSVFLVLTVLTFSLLYAACLHLAWWLRIGSLLVVWLMLNGLVFQDPETAPAPNVVCFVACALLLVLSIVRWRAGFAWWEFVTAFVVIGAATGLAPRLAAGEAQAYGFDSGPPQMTFTLSLVAGLSIPFTFLAGLAFAQLATLLAHRVGDVIDSHVTSGRGATLVAGLVGGVGVALTVRHLLGPTDSGFSHLYELGSAAVLLVLAIGLALVVVLPHAPARGRALDVLQDAVSGAALPAALLITASAVPANLAIRLGVTLRRLGLTDSTLLDDVAGFLYRSDVIAWTRIAAGLLLVAWAVWRRRTRPLPAVLSGIMGLVLLVTMIGPASDDLLLLPWTSEAVTDVAVLAAATAFVVLAATRRLTRHRALALGIALGLSLAYSVRSSFDAPFVAIFGLGATAAVFIGVVWATLTDASDANADTPRWPRPSRVLLFLANALLAMTTLAFLSVATLGEVGIDVSPFAALGDDFLGTALLLSAYAVLAREVATPQSTQPSTPRCSPAS